MALHAAQSTVKIFLGTTKDAKDLFTSLSNYCTTSQDFFTLHDLLHCVSSSNSKPRLGNLLLGFAVCPDHMFLHFSLKESCFIDLHFIRFHLSTSSREITNDSPFSAVDFFFSSHKLTPFNFPANCAAFDFKNKKNSQRWTLERILCPDG